MIRSLILASLLASSAFAAEPIVVLGGEKQTAVLELYTSEGCSSCPPADRWLSDLVEVPRQELNVLALSFHVDYWNYLGWRDRFSSADYTRRQRMLGANNLQRTIYTPEFFVNGGEARGTGNIIDKIQQVNRKSAPLELQLTVSQEGDELLLSLRTPSRRDGLGQVHHRYLVYEDDLASQVERGENRGKLLSHQRVVRYMSDSEGLRDENRHRVRIDPEWRAQNLGVAVLVTSDDDRRYLQAVHTPVGALLMAR